MMLGFRTAVRLGGILAVATAVGACAGAQLAAGGLIRATHGTRTTQPGQREEKKKELSGEQKRLLEQHVTEGVRLFRAGQWQTSVERFSAALEIAPEDAKLYVARGWALAKARRSGQAATDFMSALRYENLAEAHFGLGELAKAQLQRARTRHQVMSAFNAAESHYNRARQSDPDNPLVHLGYGTAVYLYFTHPAAYEWSRTGHFRGAIGGLAHAVRTHPGFAEGYMTLALLRSEQKDATGAVGDAERAIRLQPKNPEAYFVRGLVTSKTDRRSEAPAYARKALELDPRNPRYARALEEWQRPPAPTAGQVFAAILGLALLGAFLDDGSSGSYGSSGPGYDPWPAYMDNWANDIITSIP